MKSVSKKVGVLIFFILSSILFCSCHTTASITNIQTLNGKRIGIGEIKLSTDLTQSRNKVDTLCDCIVSSFSSSMSPFFQKSGLVLIDIPGSRKNISPVEMNQLIDSFHIDFLLVGNGLVQVQGKKHISYFMHQLSIQILNVKTREVVATGGFSGSGVYPEGAVKRICKKLSKRI